jgi:hypothetical protein
VSAAILVFPSPFRSAIGPFGRLCVSGAAKAPIGGAVNRKEKTMSRNYTLQDLQRLSLLELNTLRGALQRTLASATPGSDLNRDTLLDIAAVDWVIRLRTPGLRPRF